MPEIINTINQNDTVKIKVTVNSAALWSYVYTDQGIDYQGQYNSPPVLHALGLPHELHLKHDAWTFSFVNQTNTNTGYSAKIEWVQGVTVIHTWNDQGSIPANAMLNPPSGGDGVII